MKRLFLALLLCVGPAWAQTGADSVARREVFWERNAFRLGFKAALAQACTELTGEEYEAIVRRFAKEAEYLGTIFPSATRMLSERFASGEELARKGFVGRNGLALCRVWSPDDLQWLRDIAAGRLSPLPP